MSGNIPVTGVSISSVTLSLQNPLMTDEQVMVSYEPQSDPDEQLRDIQDNPVAGFNFTITVTTTTITTTPNTTATTSMPTTPTTAAPTTTPMPFTDADSATLRTAARDGNLATVQSLLAQMPTSAQSNAVDSNGNTALILAAAFDDIAVVQALLSSGADVTITNNSGNTAHDFARDPAILALLPETTTAPATTMP